MNYYCIYDGARLTEDGAVYRCNTCGRVVHITEVKKTKFVGLAYLRRQQPGVKDNGRLEPIPDKKFDGILIGLTGKYVARTGGSCGMCCLSGNMACYRVDCNSANRSDGDTIYVEACV